MAEGTKAVVVLALVSNTALAAAKLAAAAWTGSSAMMAEAVHSLVASANQALLLVGLKRAQRPADSLHPFGYAKELSFWSFVVAILLFSLGAGVAIYEGVGRLIDPRPVASRHLDYAVLLAGFVLMGLSAARARAEAKRLSGTSLAALRDAKDPALLTVTIQSYAAIAGLTLAALGLALSHAVGSPAPDGYAAIAVGLLLGAVAAVMSIEIRSLIVGEAASPTVMHDIRAAIAAERGVGRPIRAINEIRTMQLGATDILVAVSVDFEDGESAASVEAATSRIEQAVKARHPHVRRFFMEGQSARAHAAAEHALTRDATEGEEIAAAPAATAHPTVRPTAVVTPPAPARAQTANTAIASPPAPSSAPAAERLSRKARKRQKRR